MRSNSGGDGPLTRDRAPAVASAGARDGSESVAPLISVVAPAFNEQEVLPAFHRRVGEVMARIPVRYEIVLVNDGSTDATLDVMEALRERDPNVAVVDLSRNFGKEIALTAGLDHANGDAVVIIDADLQDPPELIPTMVEEWRNGYHVIYAQRLEREGETWLKKATAHAFYRLMQLFGPVQLPPDTGDFRLMSRQAVEGLLELRERHRFMKGLFAWVGYKQKAIGYRREPRAAGTTKWNYGKLLNLSIEGFTSFTVAPLRVAMYLGLATALLAFLYGIWILFKTLVYGEPVRGFPTIMMTLLFMGGVQLIALGVIGEYLGRVFNETKQRPLYLVQSVRDSVHVRSAPDIVKGEPGGARRYQEMLRKNAGRILSEDMDGDPPARPDAKESAS